MERVSTRLTMAAGPSSSSHRGTGVSSHSHMVAGGPCHSGGALSDPSAESVGTDTLSHLTALHTFPFSTNGTVPTSSVSVSKRWTGCCERNWFDL